MEQRRYRRPTSTQGPAPKQRPFQDISTAKRQGASFPAIGTTLSSYQQDGNTGRRYQKTSVVKSGRWQRFRSKFTLKGFVVTFALVILVIGGWLGGKFIYNAHRLFGGNILSVLSTTKLKGEDQGRVNILLAGNSADDPGHNGANLTDSIMILSIDTKNNKAFMLSVPRDLWVKIPDEGHAKINETYPDGEADKFSESDYPDGGMGALEKVIHDNLGIKPNYYALVNYNALKEAVDAVGGIDFNVKSSDPRGLYDPNIDWTTRKPLVKLTNGVHHIDGQQALDLARARGDSYRSYGFPASDFDRTEHQRQLILALKSKAATAGVLTNPAKLSSLADAIGGNVKTDMKLSEVHRLFDISKKIDTNNIQSIGLNNVNGKNLLGSYNAGGQSALIPAAGLDDFSDIQAYLRQQFSNNPLVQEAATIDILNSTTIGGLASKERAALLDKDLDVQNVGDGRTALAKTLIIDNSLGKKTSTRAYLVQRYGNNVTTSNPYSTVYTSDFIVVLGADRAAANSTSSTSSTSQ